MSSVNSPRVIFPGILKLVFASEVCLNIPELIKGHNNNSLLCDK